VKRQYVKKGWLFGVEQVTERRLRYFQKDKQGPVPPPFLLPDLFDEEASEGPVGYALGGSRVCVYSPRHTRVWIHEIVKGEVVKGNGERTGPSQEVLDNRASNVGVALCRIYESGIHVLLTDGGLFCVDGSDWTLIEEGVACFDVSESLLVYGTRNNMVVYVDMTDSCQPGLIFVREFNRAPVEVVIAPDGRVWTKVEGNVAVVFTKMDPNEALRDVVKDKDSRGTAIDTLRSLPRDTLLREDVIKSLFRIALKSGTKGDTLEVFDRANADEINQLLTEQNPDFTLDGWRELAEHAAGKQSGESEVLGKLDHYLRILNRPGLHDKRFYQPNFALFLTIPRSLLLSSLARKGDLCGIYHLTFDEGDDANEWLGNLDWSSVTPEYISKVIPVKSSAPDSLGSYYVNDIESVEVAREMVKLGYLEFQDKILVFDALKNSGVEVKKESLGVLNSEEGIRDLVERALEAQPDLVLLLAEYGQEICEELVRDWMGNAKLEEVSKGWVRDVLGESYDGALSEKLLNQQVGEEDEGGELLRGAAGGLEGGRGGELQRGLFGVSLCRKWNVNDHPQTANEFFELGWEGAVDVIFQGYLRQGYEIAVSEVLKDVEDLFENVYNGEKDYCYVTSKLAPLCVRGGDLEGVERVIKGGGLDTVKAEAVNAIDACENVEERLFNNLSEGEAGEGEQSELQR